MKNSLQKHHHQPPARRKHPVRACDEHPLVHLAVYSLSSEEIVHQLSEFELDVGLTYVDGEPLGTVRTVPLYEERFLLLTPRDSRIADATTKARIASSRLADGH